jgi:ABC-type glycerol-3-phosphate transport system permease component
MNLTSLFIIILVIAVLMIILARKSEKAKTVALHLVLTIVALIMLIPFYWMLVLSTHTTSDIIKFPPPFWFGKNLINNFKSMIQYVNILRCFGNSAFVSFTHTALVLLFCSMGGYAFALYDFPWRDKLFKILLMTMMIPASAGIIPWFVMMSRFGWINNFAALIIPGASNAFGIFWMRQYCQNNISLSLIDAARIDGCREGLIFFRIIAPILLPAYSALGIMQFVNTWNDFMNPLLILRDAKLQTLPLMLRYMLGDPNRGSDKGAMMLANTMATLPLLIAFLLASKFFMSGLTAGAIKE